MRVALYCKSEFYLVATLHFVANSCIEGVVAVVFDVARIGADKHLVSGLSKQITYRWLCLLVRGCYCNEWKHVTYLIVLELLYEHQLISGYERTAVGEHENSIDLLIAQEGQAAKFFGRGGVEVDRVVV